MTSLDIIKMAFKNLTKRKLRTALTILSVVIGASSIIIMVSLGVALDESFDEQIKQLGNITNIEIYPSSEGSFDRLPSSSSNSKEPVLTNKDINSFKQIKGVELVTPTLDGEFRFLVDNGRYTGTVKVIAVDPETAERLGYTAIEGRTLNVEDGEAYNIVANPYVAYVFDKKGRAKPYAKWIYGEEDITQEMREQKIDLLNQRLSITTDASYGVSKNYLEDPTDSSKPKKHRTFRINVVGIVNKPSEYGESIIIMPLNAFEKIKKEMDRIQGNNSSKTNGYTKVIVKAKTIDDVEKVIDEIKSIGKYTINSPIEYISSMKKLNGIVQIFLGAIGGISLFIAAIGIANTMIMAIYERTREIGIMKVIGARLSDVKRLFLLEAILIGLLGGILGVTFSYFISYIINKFAPLVAGDVLQDIGKVSSIPIWLSLVALIFSSFIGLMAGYFPAKRAVKLEPLKAIKSQ